MTDSLAKLVKKLVSRPNRVSLEEVDRVFKEFGWHLKPKTGSHFVYHKPGHAPITVLAVRHGSKWVREDVVKRIVDHLSLEEWYESRK